jgi:hypothetical protein
MNRRERQVRSARRLISDGKLIAFFDAAFRDAAPFAVELIRSNLRAGQGLDEIFYDGNAFGFSLSVDRISASEYHIEFGCQAGPLEGDGGEWQVSFDGNDVKTISGGKTWIS